MTYETYEEALAALVEDLIDTVKCHIDAHPEFMTMDTGLTALSLARQEMKGQRETDEILKSVNDFLNHVFDDGRGTE